MYIQKEKQKENKSRTVASSVVQKKSNGKQSLRFVDNRTNQKYSSSANYSKNHKTAKHVQSSGMSNTVDIAQLYRIEKATGTQGGNYVRGNTQIHLHIDIGKNTHLKVEGKTIKIVDGSGNLVQEKIQDAYNYLELFEESIKNDLQRAGSYSTPIQDCKDWLLENGATKEVEEKQSEDKEPEEKKEDEPKGYGDFFDSTKMTSNKGVQDDDDFM